MAKLTSGDVVRAIIDSCLDMPDTDLVFDALGRPDDECIEAVRLAIESGHVVMWNCPELGQSLTLTPYGAATAGVELSAGRSRPGFDAPDDDDEDGDRGRRNDSPRWCPIGSPDYPDRMLHEHKAEVRYGLEYEGFEDASSPEPLTALIVAEEYFAAVKRGDLAGETSPRPAKFAIDPDRPPRMRVLYGQRLQWPVRNVPGEPCKACFNRPLLVGYCLVCEISGLDRFMPGPDSLPRPRDEDAEESDGETNP